MVSWIVISEMVRRSPPPEDFELPALGAEGEEEWPPEHTSFDSNRVTFWELGPIPPGSVLTFVEDSEEEDQEPAIIAVAVTGSDPKDSAGVFIRVKFLGSDQAWGKTWGVSQFSRKKKGIFIRRGGEPCPRSDAVPLTEFGFWPPGTFRADYVEKRNMKEYEKFLKSLQEPEAPEQSLIVEDGAEQKLSMLRQRLLQARGKAAPSPGQGRFLRASASQRDLETSPRYGEAGEGGDSGSQLGVGSFYGEEIQGSEGSGISSLRSYREAGPWGAGILGEGAAQVSEVRDSFGLVEEKEEKEKEGEEKEEEVQQLGWVVVRVQPIFKRFKSEAPLAEESRETARLGVPASPKPCEAIAERHELSRPRGSGRSGGRKLLGKGDFLLSDHGSPSLGKSASRRERIVLIGRCARYPEVRQPGEDRRPVGRSVYGSGNCCLRWQLGYGKMVGGGKAGGEGFSPHRNPSSGSSPSTDCGPCFWPWILRKVRHWLGSWTVLRWWTMGRLVRSWPRKRKEGQARKRKREERQSRKERLRCQLVGRHAKRPRKERRGQEVRGGEMMHAPLTNEVAQRWAEELISSAFASVGTAGVLQPPFCMEGVSGSSDGSGPAGASLLEVPAGDGGPASPERFGPAGPMENDWRELLLGAPSLDQMGAIFCWGLARGFVFKGMELFTRIAKPFATCVASYPPGLFPLACDFDVFREWAWPPGNFTSSICVDCWVVLVAAALNSLYGLKPPYPRHRESVSVKKCLGVIRDRVTRFLGQELNLRPSWTEVWKDLKDKKLNYNGEEVALAQPLTFEQLLPSLPPEGHGGSVELAPLLEGRTRFLVENPDQVLLKGFDCFPGKNNAKVHVSETEAPKIFRLLFERGVIDFVSSDQVHSDRKGPFLSGMFGVPKPNKLTPGGKQALRLIMNLIPINRALEVILGDISELPTASTWQQLVLTEGDSISISQADMASAFYLFRVPPAWLKYLCFNFKLKGKDVGFPGSKEVYPACRVLPMGWASSVGIMQMASRELIRRSKLPEVDELCKQGSIPRWFVDWSRDIPSSATWWQVYLDNFMAAEVCRAGPPTGSDVQLHTLAVGAWDQTGVLCSKDKDVLGAEVATELGVQIHGPLGLLGGSMDRLFRNVLATLVLVSQNRASPKLVQIVLGRWIFVLQYRRPAMAALSRSWDYIGDPRSRWKSWPRVCEELTSSLVWFPFSSLISGWSSATWSPVLMPPSLVGQLRSQGRLASREKSLRQGFRDHELTHLSVLSW